MRRAFKIEARILVQYVLSPLLVIVALDHLLKQFDGIHILTSFLMFKTEVVDGALFRDFAFLPLSLRFFSVAACLLSVVFFSALAQILFPFKSRRMRWGVALAGSALFSSFLDQILYGNYIHVFILQLPPHYIRSFALSDLGMVVAMVIVGKEWILPKVDFAPGFDPSVSQKIVSRFQYRVLFTCLGVALVALSVLVFVVLALAKQFAPQVYAGIAYITICLSLMAFAILSLKLWRLSARILAQRRGGSTDSSLVVRRLCDLFKSWDIDSAPLGSGEKAPTFRSENDVFSELSHFKGRKVWLCLYRYATCPVCTTHLAEVVEFEKFLQRAGVQVVVVFESGKDQFIKADTGRTADLLGQLPFPVIFDVEKKIYQAYSTKSSLLAVFRPQVIWTLLKARVLGFKQGSIDGDLGQIPAHFLILPDGRIHRSYYGSTLADHISWTTVRDFMNLEAAF